MIKLVWKGKFENVGTGKEKTFTLNLSGVDLDELHQIIREYVECKEDSGWALLENEITEIAK